VRSSGAKFFKWGNSFVLMLRKIKTQEEIARKRKRNQILVGGILIVLMIVSTLGYSLMDSEDNGSDSVNELGIDFVRDDGLWKIVLDDAVFGFQYLPSEVDDVIMSGNYNAGDYGGEILYFVNANNGASEILNNLGRYVLRYQDACLGNSNCIGDFPLKNCDSNLIIFELGNETAVWKNESCVYIVGDSVRGADAFLYKALKIT